MRSRPGNSSPAPYTTPARFQTLLFSLAAQPDGLEWLKHKHDRLRTVFRTGWTN